ncbi:MAG: hypothetical protein MI754_18090, partial [Chromatiales bacterium]|nr:hypothetical protein [Chromatiales bacterium]
VAYVDSLHGAPSALLDYKMALAVIIKLVSTGPKSSFSLKSTKNNSVFWINPKKWAFSKSDDGNEAAEYNFQLRGKDLYAMAITEEITIDIENLAQIALENAREAAPNARITKREYRIVNGNKVIFQQMEGTIQGINFTYLGYYYSNDTGSTQYLTYTATSLVSKYRTKINGFLNGFANKL